MIPRVEICGGIAAGKTTLAKLLTELGFRPVFESFRENPFWEAFYTSPGKYIFETEVTFTLQHFHQLRKEAELGRPVVADFSTYLDASYAEIGLAGSQLKVFEAVRRETLRELGPPQVLIHLRCSANVELRRIRGRARREESQINVEFLRRLNAAVAHRVKKLPRATQYLQIDSSRVDFAHDHETRARVLGTLKDRLTSVF